MTKVRVIKTGEVMYLISVMPRMGVKGGCGGKAIAMCAADPRKHGAENGQRYAVVQYPMKSLEIVEEFNWEEMSSSQKPVEERVIDSPGEKVNIPIEKPATTDVAKTTTSSRSGRRSRERNRFEASQKFAAMKVCFRMVKVASSKAE